MPRLLSPIVQPRAEQRCSLAQQEKGRERGIARERYFDLPPSYSPSSQDQVSARFPFEGGKAAGFGGCPSWADIPRRLCLLLSFYISSPHWGRRMCSPGWSVSGTLGPF